MSNALSNVLPINTESLFTLYSGLSSILLTATAADNYIYKEFTSKI